MDQATVKEKIQNLEAEIKILKTAVAKRPDFAIDDSNWRKIKPAVKKARTEIAKEIYG